MKRNVARTCPKLVPPGLIEHSAEISTLGYPPPFVLPHPLCLPGGGGHLVITKFFFTAHLVDVWVTVL